MTQDNPNTYADVRLNTGEQGSGKTTNLVAFSVGDTYSKLTGFKTPNGTIIKARSLDDKDKAYLKSCHIIPNKLFYARIFSEDVKQSKLIKIPNDWLVISPVRIFANFTLYGIRYVPISLMDIIENMNEPMFNDSWILSDESVMTDARNSMDALGKLGATFGATLRKRNTHFCLSAQYNEMVERRFRLFATTRITCSYDEDTRYITCEIKKRGEPEFTTDYYAPQYWKFFDTRELVKVPQYKIDRALSRIYKTEVLAR